jgi:hypothetical protein
LFSPSFLDRLTDDLKNLDIGSTGFRTITCLSNASWVRHFDRDRYLTLPCLFAFTSVLPSLPTSRYSLIQPLGCRQNLLLQEECLVGSAIFSCWAGRNHPFFISFIYVISGSSLSLCEPQRIQADSSYPGSLLPGCKYKESSNCLRFLGLLRYVLGLSPYGLPPPCTLPSVTELSVC